MSASALTESQKNHFIHHGWLKLQNCFTPEAAAPYTSTIWARLGMDPSDKSTWTRDRVHLPATTEFDSTVFAPRAWAAVCELLGGEERVRDGRMWRDAFIVSLGPPGEKVESVEKGEKEKEKKEKERLWGWHVDGDWFIHHLDSPELGLITVPLFTKVTSGQGGATVLCPEGMKKVAHWLYSHPGGVDPGMAPVGTPRARDWDWYNGVAGECASEGFVEVTGDAGDVYLLHPLMLHSASGNLERRFRVIANRGVGVREPFRFWRDGGGLSGVERVERATVLALGKGAGEMRGWGITGRRGVVGRSG